MLPFNYKLLRIPKTKISLFNDDLQKSFWNGKISEKLETLAGL
jgi:hypothetical protein